ncbi:(2Fe-2S)-binding protein [Candidatus Izimaplasma bacterium ZiA1]|uniref:(2Fe-2S)-binding protein n=1 Tax=Candidatus Izimoplasma sp. ZiA1 TaxID=2024899 RepID=UPI000BAA3841|nr:(2Fe-2S)-binding protein [Candidatus Izimaplasma bacterium ZiA1]
MEDKVICCCHNVKLSDIENNIKDGVKTFEELQEKTNIGTDCPPCKDSSEKLFNSLLIK